MMFLMWCFQNENLFDSVSKQHMKKKTVKKCLFVCLTEHVKNN